MTKSPPSPSQLARNERMRTAAIEGAKARSDIEARDIAVRKNMERLRALRMAKEAEEAAQPKPVKAPARAKKAAPKQAGQTVGFPRGAEEHRPDHVTQIGRVRQRNDRQNLKKPRIAPGLFAIPRS